jgi:TatD DNase family protein
LHPHEARDWGPGAAAWLEHALADSTVVAAGEMGLDYHYDFSPRDRQREAFEAQMALAARHGRPAVIHAREADDDVAAVLRNHPATIAILHSFSSGPGLLRTGIALGHYVSWSGMITFRNWTAEALLREVPLDRLLVETDAPYLAPVPHRGRRNEPAFVVQVAARVATLLGRPLDEIAALTSGNAARVFGVRVAPTPQEAL